MTNPKNLKAPYTPDDYDLMVAATLDMVMDGVPHQAVYDLTIIAQTAPEYYAGMQAMVELGDILKDHHEYRQQEPDDGTYTEEEDAHIWKQWGTEADDFDPPPDWFDDGGPFGPEDPEDL